MSLRSIYTKLRIILYQLLSAKSVKIEGNFIKSTPVLFEGKGTVKFGKNIRIGYYPSPGFFDGNAYIEVRNNNSSIEIDDNTIFNNRLVIICDKTSIKIGKNCLFGINVWLSDSDFHGIKVADRLNGNYECKSEEISDNVFVGNNVTILKGVTIGKNCVIASGSIVTKSFPDNTVVGGVPAKFLKYIDE